MSRRRPRVSIGLPVYNGERHIREAIDSILAQTFTDFELIISDNASTDRTQEICRTYSARDERIRYHRNDENLGAARNFNRVFALSSGDYFKWAAHDDMLDPQYLAKCVQILDSAADSTVLCCCNAKFVNEQGGAVGGYDVRLNGANRNAPARFREVINLPEPCFGIIIFGLVRASTLRKTRLFGRYFEWDHILTAELSLLGAFAVSPERLFWSRRHGAQSFRAPGWRNRALWMDPYYRGRHWLTRVGLVLERVNSVMRSDLRWSEKGLCLIHMTHFVGKRTLKLLVRSAWWAWSWLSLQALRASKYTYLPLRIWAFVRFLRATGWSKHREAIRYARTALTSELLCRMTLAVISRRDESVRKTLIAWLSCPGEAHRFAAASAIAAYLADTSGDMQQKLQEDRAYYAAILRKQVRCESSTRVLHAIVEALLQNTTADDAVVLAETLHSKADLDGDTRQRLMDGLGIRPTFAPVGEEYV